MTVSTKRMKRYNLRKQREQEQERAIDQQEHKQHISGGGRTSFRILKMFGISIICLLFLDYLLSAYARERERVRERSLSVVLVIQHILRLKKRRTWVIDLVFVRWLRSCLTKLTTTITTLKIISIS